MKRRIDRSKIAGRLADRLLTTTCLTPISWPARLALANGGAAIAMASAARSAARRRGRTASEAPAAAASVPARPAGTAVLATAAWAAPAAPVELRLAVPAGTARMLLPRLPAAAAAAARMAKSCRRRGEPSAQPRAAMATRVETAASAPAAGRRLRCGRHRHGALTGSSSITGGGGGNGGASSPGRPVTAAAVASVRFQQRQRLRSGQCVPSPAAPAAAATAKPVDWRRGRHRHRLDDLRRRWLDCRRQRRYLASPPAAGPAGRWRHTRVSGAG